MPSFRTNVVVGGQSSVTASTNGNATTAHGCDVAPVAVLAQILGDDTTASVDVESIDGTNITWRFYAKSNGADVTSGTRTVMWVAYLKAS